MEEVTRILVAMAHPDDPEYSCAAAVADWVDQGVEQPDGSQGVAFFSIKV